MRIEMMESKSKLMILGSLYFDLVQIDEQVIKFSNTILPKKERTRDIYSLLEAKSQFELAITILKNIIEKPENKLINKIDEEYFSIDILNVYFDLFLTILDIEQENMERYVKEVKQFVNPAIVPVAIKSFREKLIDYMKSLIVMPIYRASLEFQNNISKYNEEEYPQIFEYILFREIFIASKLKGSQDRHQASMAKSPSKISFNDVNIDKRGMKKTINPFSNEAKNPPPLEIIDPFEEDIEGGLDVESI